MKIGDPTYRGAEVHLPIEVLSLITAHLTSGNYIEPQKSLWACCLVSHDWYAASISHLYFRPHLSPRNFDIFARTICPPLKVRKPRFGLQGMIKHLDMREIAYESSNSLTSRLINRARSSLESFHPPAVTFSVASLAPLSKCSNLRLLDMSGDRYSITLGELLGSIRDLESLTSLGLPKDILSDKDRPVPSKLHWPENLTRLHASGAICSHPQTWDVLFRSWPVTLTNVMFPDCDYGNYPPFARLGECQEIASFVQRLEIGSLTREMVRPAIGTLFDILFVFPRLKHVTIPDDLARNTLTGAYRPNIEEAARGHFSLETLVIHGDTFPRPSWTFPWDDRPQDEVCAITLARLSKVPKLRRLEIRGSFIEGDMEAKEQTLKVLSEILEKRASAELRASSGIFLLDDP